LSTQQATCVLETADAQEIGGDVAQRDTYTVEDTARSVATVEIPEVRRNEDDDGAIAERCRIPTPQRAAIRVRVSQAQPSPSPKQAERERQHDGAESQPERTGGHKGGNRPGSTHGARATA
jgi:hypothetical protein